MNRWVTVTAAFVLTLLCSASASAETYPSRPITVTVPFAPGGSADLAIRVVGQKLTASLGQPVVVENRPGAGGELGVGNVVRAAPDGYNLLLTTNGPISVISNFRKVSYNPADLAPVAMLVKVPAAIAVNASLPIKNIADLIKYSKEHPGGISYGMAGPGTQMHLAGEIFRAKTGADIVAVPYKGTAPTALAVKTGEVQMGIADLTSLMPFAKEGSIRILGLVDSTRSSVAPDIPTVAESGVPGFGVNAWIGVCAPKDTPQDIVARLNTGINDALALPDVRQRMITAGLDPWIITPTDLDSFLSEDIARWKTLLSEVKVNVD
jgi:tripartite-type tricarboxylate transporter receptor subunit TctC